MVPDQVSGGRFCPFSGQYNSVSAIRTSFAPWPFFSVLKEDELDAGDHDYDAEKQVHEKKTLSLSPETKQASSS